MPSPPNTPAEIDGGRIVSRNRFGRTLSVLDLVTGTLTLPDEPLSAEEAAHLEQLRDRNAACPDRNPARELADDLEFGGEDWERGPFAKALIDAFSEAPSDGFAEYVLDYLAKRIERARQHADETDLTPWQGRSLP